MAFFPKVKSLGEFLQATIWSVQSIFGNKDAQSHLDALHQVNSQETEMDRDIFNRVEQPGIEFVHVGLLGVLDSVGDSVRGIVKGAGGIIKGLFNGIEFVFKKFWLILIALIVLVGAWYLINLKKMVK